MKIIIRERPPLCESCHHGALFTRAGIGPLVACRWLNRILPADVQTCSRYQGIGSASQEYVTRADALIIDPRPAPPSAERGYT